MSKQHKDHLDQELDHILTPLGVKREYSSTQDQRQKEHENGRGQGGEIHITCIYEREDRRLWSGVYQHLSLLKHPHGDGELCWHEEILSGYYNQPVEIERATMHFLQSPLILLCVSVDLLVAFLRQVSGIYQALQRTYQEQAPQIVLVMLRPVTWDHKPFVDPLILPRHGTLTTRQRREQVHVEIAQDLSQAIKDLCL